MRERKFAPWMSPIRRAVVWSDRPPRFLAASARVARDQATRYSCVRVTILGSCGYSSSLSCTHAPREQKQKDHACLQLSTISTIAKLRMFVRVSVCEYEGEA